ncbi:MAG: hypothetical protein ACLR9T_03280 [Thomasclavelia sp.]|uniref:hypothetical protein n=1 Tax=Thomasclavelia sp. TaxID=3025757 RepID=UPI00399FFE70
MKYLNIIKINRSQILLMITVMICITAIGSVYAWSKLSASVTNKINTPTIDVEVIEEFDEQTTVDWYQPVDKKVQFKNIGTAPIFIRVSYVELWRNTNNQVLSSIVNGQEIVKKNWTDAWKNEWIDGNDGWFYYKKILQPNNLCSKILTSLEFDSSNLGNLTDIYGNASYSLKFFSEAVQYSKDIDVNRRSVKANFGIEFVDIDDNGNITWK